MARQAMATGSSPDATTTQCTTMQCTALNTVFLNPDSGWMNFSTFGSVIQWMNTLPHPFFFWKETKMWALENNLFLCPFVFQTNNISSNYNLVKLINHFWGCFAKSFNQCTTNEEFCVHG
jgi:hypothetical protein